MSERPLVDPLSDSLVNLTEEQRAEAMRRFKVLRSHVVDGVSLVDSARAVDLPLRTVQRWATKYRSDGLAGLARSRRSDADQRKCPAALVELIEGLALQKPRLSAAAIHRRVAPMAESRSWQAPSYATVYAIVRDLDPSLLTLAHGRRRRLPGSL